jgi:hypothetical protein
MSTITQLKEKLGALATEIGQTLDPTKLPVLRAEREIVERQYNEQLTKEQDATRQDAQKRRAELDPQREELSVEIGELDSKIFGLRNDAQEAFHRRDWKRLSDTAKQLADAEPKRARLNRELSVIQDELFQLERTK